MGSYENIVKMEEIKRKVDEGDLLSAQKVLDTIEIKKIKNMTDLNLIAEVYSENQRYEEAADLYLKIYDKVKSRKTLFQLIEILIKLNNAEDAEFYLRQYYKIAPKDFYNYVFRYKIDKIKGESFEHLIEILEDLKKTEYTEKWAYELAKLYYKAGMEEECIRECSDIELWFGEGTYVEKAKILRSYYSGETDKDKILEEIKRRAEVISNKNDERSQPVDIEADAYVNGTEDSAEDSTEDGTEDGTEDSTEDSAEENEYMDKQYEQTTQQESSYDPVGDFYSNTNFIVREDTEGFEDGLKKDVRTFMINEQPEDTSYYSYKEELPEQRIAFLNSEEKTYYEAEQDTYGTEGLSNMGAMIAEGALSEEAEVSELTEEADVSELSEEAEVSELSEEVEESTITETTFNTKPLDEIEKADTTSEPIDTKDADQEAESTNYRLLEEEQLDEEDIKLRQLAIELQIIPEELFGNFLHVLAVKKQLVKSLETIMNDRSRSLMMIITGTEGAGKTTLAKDIALFLNKAGKIKSSKLAKITADKLNTVDIMAKMEILRDCCLVIENASGLKRSTIDSLLELSMQLHGDIAVIFEEDKKNMNKLFREYPKLMDLLKNRIHLPQYTTDDLMGFAHACLKQKDYRIDSKVEQILQSKINQITKQSEPHRHLEQIYDLMQAAMNAADIRMGKQLTALASQGRLKDVDTVTIMKEDF